MITHRVICDVCGSDLGEMDPNSARLRGFVNTITIECGMKRLKQHMCHNCTDDLKKYLDDRSQST